MKLHTIHDFLNEGKYIIGEKLIVCDIQPGHEHLSEQHFATSDFVDTLNLFNGPVLYLYNGPNSGFQDTEESIKEWLKSYGYDKDFSNIQFYEKGYGYLREAMDNWKDTPFIKLLISYMINSNTSDSRNLDFVKLFQSKLNYQKDRLQQLKDEKIVINLHDDLQDQLKKYDGAILVGGSLLYCFAEIEILMDCLGIMYQRNNDFIYQ